MGITEANPVFVWPAPHRVDAPYVRWRDELERMRPSHYRLVVDWAAIQAQPDAAPNFDLQGSGCSRAGQPCAPWAGLREQLRALAARQRADAGAWETLVVLDGTPAWAGADVRGCRQKAGGERARPPSDEGLEALKGLVEGILAVAREEGASLRWWSARNEPNPPLFLAPQRRACSARAPSVSVAAYAAMARAMRAALDAEPGRQEYVLGEAAGVPERRPRSTSVAELVRALPRDLVCGTSVWSQHAYVGGDDVAGQAVRALDRIECPRRHRVWITETGAGGTQIGRSRAATGPGATRECRALHRQLVRWYEDPRVAVAFQYTLREDELFPTGLVDPALERAYPALAEWQAWGTAQRPEPGARPPASTCG